VVWYSGRLFLSAGTQLLMFCQQARDTPKNQSVLLHWQLEPSLRVSIIQAEVAADDRDRQSDDQHATNCASSSNDFSRPSLRSEITVTHRRHGDKAPPEGLWDRVEYRIVIDHYFNVVYDA